MTLDLYSTVGCISCTGFLLQNETYFIVGAKAKLGAEPREAADRVFPDAAAAICWR